jgi:hypothetical protein
VTPADISALLDAASKLTIIGLLITFIVVILRERPPLVTRKHHEDVIEVLIERLSDANKRYEDALSDIRFWRDLSMRKDDLVERQASAAEKAIETAKKALKS